MTTPVKVPIEDLMADIDKVMARQADWSAKWSLALTIGNGAALAALAGKVLGSSDASLIKLALPSLWFFAIGLTIGGALPLIEMRRAGNLFFKHRVTLDNALRLNQKEVLRNPPTAPDWTFWAATALEMLAAAMFVLGIMVPLIRLTITHAG